MTRPRRLRPELIAVLTAVSLVAPLPATLGPTKARAETPAASASAAAPMDYTPGLIDSLLAEGRVVFVDYKASWCTTCAAQERVIARLLAENPEYAERIAFVNVDWDQWKRDPVTTGRDVPRRSTLLLLQGDRELFRIVAGTSEKDIRAMLDRGLQAAAA
ncbi:thioredoxin family protein [Frigidibacter oleivorans]|uniref:thioredoxin family protein n=1 Tax=Frigidibacter oleivorans TaxID=2487129 RepID=UPI000F8EC66C|nr:thioredoxin family protein [Frigidibacter oleivorans]